MAKTILLVDDSNLIVMSVKQNLTMAGFNVETASDGVQAMMKLKTGLKPDMIITDINMPNMGGFELIKNVRALPGFRFIPLLTMTTESQAEKKEEGKKLGATGWLVKPVGGAALISIIKKLLPGA